MKKFLGILVIAASLVACNNSSDGSATNDSVTNTVDSNTTVNQTINTTTDSTKVVVDSLTKKDSVNK